MANVTIMGADYQNVNEIYLIDTDTGDELKFVLEVVPTREVIIPEQTITPTADYTMVDFNAPLIADETYIYTVNGVEASGSAQSLYGSIYLNVRGYSSGTGVGFEYSNGVMYVDTKLRTEITVKVEKTIT